MKNKELKRQIYFIGIGGIGMSALAQYYLSEGWEVSGSDVASSDITKMLKKQGVKMFIRKITNHKYQITDKSQIINTKLQTYIKKADLVVYSAAISEKHEELLLAKRMGVKTLSYAEALGELTRKYKTICVSGTHGKSTTTAMLALIMIKAQLDPTVILGTKLKEFSMYPVQQGTYGSNFRKGKGEWLLIEADEFNASFLNYSPQMIVLTNIEVDHLDYYKDLNDIIRTFKEYVGNLADSEMLVVNGDDNNIKSILNHKQISSFKSQTKKYSLEDKMNVKKLKKVLKVPGEYNIYNALAALAAARALKISDKISFKALGEFKGAWRRMETIGKYKGIKIISDYAHHPTEIKAVLGAISNFKSQSSNMMVVFQPHQQYRTEKLFDDFVKAFGETSRDLKLKTCNFIITDIYEVAGREQGHKNKDAKCLVDSVNKKYPNASVIYVPRKRILELIQGFEIKLSVVVFMGAGDIDALARELVTSD